MKSSPFLKLLIPVSQKHSFKGTWRQNEETLTEWLNRSISAYAEVVGRETSYASAGESVASPGLGNT